MLTVRETDSQSDAWNHFKTGIGKAQDPPQWNPSGGEKDLEPAANSTYQQCLVPAQ
eukprot:CAMPEP_0171314970 /NCGR_PEP_ID=MMETSP0816-20121228/59113_1 /TAXON_ID=420281 /ORGANISM="Proboscia inermis, Strain CCAP1064/1" /LENGTH=55 /DNA_ID=CAMNT_0011804833 /DNA_START=106 /DNA_END=270 /DNA_ORIENTATION=+